MQMTKEKVSIPGLDDSPLSPLPQQLLDEAGNKKTPPPYITLESLAKVPGLELKSYDGGGDSSCMGSLSSYNNTRVRRGMDTHATGLRSRGSYRQKNPAELQAAIRRQMVKLQHLQQSIKAMEQQNPITDQATAALVTPARDGNGSTHAEAKEAEVMGRFAHDTRIRLDIHDHFACAPTQQDASGQNEQKNNGKVPTIATGFSSAFDASQLSLLRNYIEQNGGLPVRF